MLSNVAKYAEPGGQIRLTAARDGGEVVVRVKDRGIGIPADLLPRIFEMFAHPAGSPEATQGGLGIGLSLVKTL